MCLFFLLPFLFRGTYIHDFSVENDCRVKHNGHSKISPSIIDKSARRGSLVLCEVAVAVEIFIEDASSASTPFIQFWAAAGEKVVAFVDA
jgi:hypothetical protein